jgi:hypothetical protein
VSCYGYEGGGERTDGELKRRWAEDGAGGGRRVMGVQEWGK